MYKRQVFIDKKSGTKLQEWVQRVAAEQAVSDQASSPSVVATAKRMVIADIGERILNTAEESKEIFITSTMNIKAAAAAAKPKPAAAVKGSSKSEAAAAPSAARTPLPVLRGSPVGFAYDAIGKFTIHVQQQDGTFQLRLSSLGQP